ncbi:MAG TPA: hypothetical protein VGM18_15155 [Candidatus Sulfotelmatobacter sp.]|jgi:hypothetical protein
MRKKETYFEQIPVRNVKEIIVPLPQSKEAKLPVSHPVSHSVLHCAICSQPVPVETAKTDSHGRAIHEACYLFSVAGKITSSGTLSGSNA